MTVLSFMTQNLIAILQKTEFESIERWWHKGSAKKSTDLISLPIETRLRRK